jgi:hypothetical protein
MSHWINGRYYSTAAEYLAATHQQTAHRAEALAAQLQQETSRSRQRLQATEDALRQAEGNYDRQLELNRLLGQDVAGLRRQQAVLRQATEELRAESDHRFRDLRDSLAGNAADLAELQRRHERHREQMAAQFAQMEQQLAAGLAEAEQRRLQAEARLQQAIRRVDEKIEAERAERLAQARSELDRAVAQIELAEGLLHKQRDRSAALNLGEEVESVEEMVATARRLHERGEAAAALAASELAFASARTLGHKAARRQAQLTAARARIHDAAAHLQELLTDEVVRRYFPREAALAAALLDRLQRRAEHGYGSHARLEVEADDDERNLAALEREVLLMVREAPVVQGLYREREQRILQLLGHLVQVADAPPVGPAGAGLGRPAGPQIGPRRSL